MTPFTPITGQHDLGMAARSDFPIMEERFLRAPKEKLIYGKPDRGNDY